MLSWMRGIIRKENDALIHEQLCVVQIVDKMRESGTHMFKEIP